MAHQPHEINLAGANVRNQRHICAFFSSRDEEYRVMLPFLAEGLKRGEKVMQIMDPAEIDNHCNRLRELGINTDALRTTKQLELLTWHETYLAGGKFVQEEMVERLPALLDAPRAEGYPLTRLVGHMDWSLKDLPSVDDMLEYEARANIIFAQHEDPVICVYDLTKYNAAFIMDVMRTHPMVIIGGVLQENPFYVPPEIFLEELKARKAQAITGSPLH